MNGHWQWQEKGNSWRGVGIYHVTASAMIRHPQKAAFGELKWQVVDGQIDGAYVEWSPFGQSLWDCIQQIPVRHPQIQIVAARIMPDHLHMVLHITDQTDLSIREIIRGWVQGCRKAAKAHPLRCSSSPQKVFNFSGTPCGRSCPLAGAFCFFHSAFSRNSRLLFPPFLR